ncbi:MAG TPA: CorA family divalent cation transporter, partial [Chroococcales cyanobacterium]
MSDRSHRRKPKKSRMFTVRPFIDPARPPSTATMTVLAYAGEKYVERVINGTDELESYIGTWPVVWLNIDGLTDRDLLTDVGNYFGIRHLSSNDAITLQQRAKFEKHAHVYNLICHMVAVQDGVQSEQLNIFLGSNFVITLQDGPIDCLDPARERIRKNTGIICRMGPDYLVYSLVQSVVGAYFPILELYGERLDQLEDQIIDYPTREVIAQIHTVKRDLLALRRTIWPLREAIN